MKYKLQDIQFLIKIFKIFFYYENENMQFIRIFEYFTLIM